MKEQEKAKAVTYPYSLIDDDSLASTTDNSEESPEAVDRAAVRRRRRRKTAGDKLKPRSSNPNELGQTNVEMKHEDDSGGGVDRAVAMRRRSRYHRKNLRPKSRAKAKAKSRIRKHKKKAHASMAHKPRRRVARKK